jgi:hypothetical protein
MMTQAADYTAEELQEAQELSTALDRFLAARRQDEDAETSAALASLGPAAPVVRDLVALNEMFGPVPTALQDQIEQKLRKGTSLPVPTHPPTAWRWLRSPWVLRPLAAVLLVVCLTAAFLWTQPGQQAMAALRAILQAGTVHVEVEPEGAISPTPSSLATMHVYQGAVEQDVPDLETAHKLVSFPLLEPAVLPEGYGLQHIWAVSFPDGPVWLQGPFFLEMRFAPAGAVPELVYLSLRQSGVNPSQGFEITSLRLRSEDVLSADQVNLDGKEAALLVMQAGGSGSSVSRSRLPPPLRELVWQQGAVMVELGSQVLDTDGLMRVARSLH